MSASLRAATKDAAAGKAYNIGTGKTITINRLWQKVAELAGIALAPDYEAARHGDILHSVASIDAARRDLGFSPEISFEEGLARTYAWYQRQ